MNSAAIFSSQEPVYNYELTLLKASGCQKSHKLSTQNSSSQKENILTHVPRENHETVHLLVCF